MTDKRRHSLAEIFSPHPNSKDKKRWSFDSFSPLNLGISIHSKWKRRYSTEIDPELIKHSNDHGIDNNTSAGTRWKRRASVAVGADNILPDKHDHNHHHGVFSLWRRRSSVQHVQSEHNLLSKELGSPLSSSQRPDFPRRRSSIAVPNFPPVKNLHHETKITFKIQKNKSKRSNKEYFLAIVYFTNGTKRWVCTV